MLLPARKILLLFLLLFVKQVQAFQITKSDSLELISMIDSAFELHSVNYKNAVSLCNACLQKADKSKSPNLMMNALYTSAYLDWFDGSHLDALDKCEQSLAISKHLEDTFKIAENHTLKGLIYLYLSDFDSAILSFEQGLTSFSAIKDTAQVLRNYGFIGLVYNKQGNYLKTKENLMEQVVIQRQFGAADWNVIRFDDSKNNQKYFLESLINAKNNLLNYPPESKASKNKRFAYRNVGLIFRELNKLDSALYYLKKSVEVANKLNADPIWFDIAKTYTRIGFYDSAFWAAEKSINDAKDHGTRIILSYSYSAKGHIYVAIKQHNQAIIEYSKALGLEKLMLHKSAQTKLYLNISKQFIIINKLSKAFAYADSSLLLAKKIGSLNDIVNALKIQFQVQKKMKNYKKAFALRETYDLLIDSLQRGKVQLDLAKLDLYHDVALNKVSISKLSKQQKINQVNLKNRNLSIIIISILAFFTVLILVFNFIRNQKLSSINSKLNELHETVEKQNKELTDSNNEKALLLGEIHHRVKNNLQTITSLLSMQQRKLSDSESIKVLEDSKNRVMAMGLIHQHLYQNSTFGSIDFKNYTKDLVGILVRTNATCAIDVTCSIPTLKIDLDNAIYFGLMINELAINSIKHAYANVAHPRLEITIKEQGNKTILRVHDNGTEKDINFEKSNSFGWKMVNNISDKLGGEIKTDTSNGLCIKITFDKDLIHIV